MSNQVVGPLQATKPAPNEAVLLDTLNLALLLTAHHGEVTSAGYAHWQTPLLPVFLGSTALAAVMQLHMQANPGSASPEACELLAGVLLPTHNMPVEVFFAENDSADLTDGERSRQLLDHLQMAHHEHRHRPYNSAPRWTVNRQSGQSNDSYVDLHVERVQRLPLAPLSANGLPQVAGFYSTCALRQSFLRDHRGRPLPLRFLVPTGPVLYYTLIRDFVHSNNLDRRIALFRLLILNEFPPFHSSTTLLPGVFDLFRNGSDSTRREFDTVLSLIHGIRPPREIRAQVQWHLQRQVTDLGAGMIWNEQELSEAYHETLLHVATTIENITSAPSSPSSPSSSSNSLAKRFFPQSRSRRSI
ncbi:hypothetical protein JCM8547_006469 [Rhodosporidiobolus lusitaniae]